VFINKGVDTIFMAFSYYNYESTTVGTSYVTTQKTIQKLLLLYKTNPTAALKIAQLFKITLPGITNATEDLNFTDLDKYTQNLIRTLFAVEMYVFVGITSTTDTIAGGISKTNVALTKNIQSLKQSINKALTPVSSQTGQTGSNPVTTPLGAPAAIGKSLAHIIDKVNPGFTDRLEASLKQLKISDLQHIGTNVLGGLRSLASTVDAVLSVPLSIASDVYNGLMDIMNELSSLLDSLVSGIIDLIFGPKGLLDSLVPMSAINDFLNVLNGLSSVIGSISGTFSGLTTVTGAVSNLNNYASTGIGLLTNPTFLASSMLPPGSTQFVSGLRNPQQLVSNLVPPNINQQLGNVGNLPGLGFVGNLGYGIGGTLESMQDGVVTGIVDRFSSQLGVIGAQLGKPSSNKPATDTTAVYSPTIEPSVVNPNIPVVDGYPVSLTPEQDQPIFQQKNSSNPLASLNSPVPLGAPSAENFNLNTGIQKNSNPLILI
jgi:hypothetical protein